MTRPSRLLIANSLLFMAACQFASGFAVSGFSHWDPCVWFTAVLLLAPCLLLTYLQYVATFHENRQAAIVLAVLLLLLCLWMLLPLGLGLTPLLFGYSFKPDWFGLILPLVAVIVWMAFTSWLAL